MMTVSIIESGAGSVARLRAARLAEHAIHFGELFDDAVLTCSSFCASVMEMPGIVEGM